MRRVVLVGFMGSGKSTIGPRIARRLGWRFHDVDREIERAEGRSVAQLFRDPGEAYFRRLEAERTARLLEADGAVLAPGGGWAARPGRLESLPAGTLSVWLRVSAEEALRRLRGGGARPLLEVGDPLEAARSLLREREAAYGRAHWALDTERRSPEDLAQAVAERVRAAGGRGPGPAG